MGGKHDARPYFFEKKNRQMTCHLPAQIPATILVVKKLGLGVLYLKKPFFQLQNTLQTPLKCQ
jgi:hypothetical protein